MWTLECELRSVWDRSKLMRTLFLNELRSIQTFCHPWRFSLLTKVFNQRVLDLKLCFYGGINWHYFVNHTRCGWALCRSVLYIPHRACSESCPRVLPRSFCPASRVIHVSDSPRHSETAARKRATQWRILEIRAPLINMALPVNVFSCLRVCWLCKQSEDVFCYFWFFADALH